jgi:hypothetical protein
MKKFPHQQFIEDNDIPLDTLPKMLKKRIEGFEELENDLQHTTEHDRDQLIDKLELLSHELQEDLEEQFEDQLENNDEEADDPVPVEPEKEKDEIIAEPSPASANEVNVSTNNPIASEDNQPSSGDEGILQQLYVAKQLNISPLELIRKGLKTRLDDRIIKVGKYALYRGKYDTNYQLLLTEK